MGNDEFQDKNRKLRRNLRLVSFSKVLYNAFMDCRSVDVSKKEDLHDLTRSDDTMNDDSCDLIISQAERYSRSHISVIKLLLPYIKEYFDISQSGKNLLPYYTFSFQTAEKITDITGNILHDILHDFTVDNLLIFQPYTPFDCWTVTEIGFICFPRILEKYEK
jgi:hypothetical protein